MTSLSRIRLPLIAEEIVVNNTVKIMAYLAGMVKEDRALQSSLRVIMQAFIPNADWQFSNLTRKANQSGVEEFTVTATTRVSEAENYNLDQRANDVSEPGLRIIRVQPDLSVPLSMIAEAEQRLRRTITEKALDEAQKMSEVTGQQFSLYKLDFTENAWSGVANVRAGSPMVMAASTSYGSDFGDSTSTEAIGNAQKLTMQAIVTLAADRVRA